MSIILGINAFHAGASATLLIDGEPMAIQEERLNKLSIMQVFQPCQLKMPEIGGIDISQVEHVAVGRDYNANKWEKIKYTFKTFSAP